MKLILIPLIFLLLAAKNKPTDSEIWMDGCLAAAVHVLLTMGVKAKQINPKAVVAVCGKLEVERKLI